MLLDRTIYGIDSEVRDRSINVKRLTLYQQCGFTNGYILLRTINDYSFYLLIAIGRISVTNIRTETLW